jgi:Fe-S-cluster containining protein
MLGPGESERLQSLEWRGRADELVSASISTMDGDRSVLSRREDGACVFLGAANQCRIHEHFGAEAKPLMCRLFPFGFFPVGERVAVDVSFACRSISEGSGATLKLRTPEWAKLASNTKLGANTGTRGGETKHRFSKRYDVVGTLLWELEHHLVQLLSNRELTLLERIQAISEFVRLATTSDPATEAARKLRQVMASGVVDLVKARRGEALEPLDKTQRAIFFHLLFVLVNPTPIELRAASGKARQREIKRRVLAADGYRFDKAAPWLDNRELSVSYETIAAVSAAWLADGEGAELAARYLEAKIIGQRFMRDGEVELPFLEAVPRLLLMFPMLVWTSKALAAEEGVRKLTEAHVRRGLRLLDRSYGAVRLSELPAKQRKAWQFVLMETDMPTCASAAMLSSAGT